jgi:DNA repair protein RecO (recombination protein O)
MSVLPSTAWLEAYIMWELKLLESLGFGLDWEHCAVTGVTTSLSHISPKSGRAVCAEAAAPYAHKLLVLPPFLCRRNREEVSMTTTDDYLAGLRLTGHFLQSYVFDHLPHGMPFDRQCLLGDLIGNDDNQALPKVA